MASMQVSSLRRGRLRVREPGRAVLRVAGVFLGESCGRWRGAAGPTGSLEEQEESGRAGAS